MAGELIELSRAHLCASPQAPVPYPRLSRMVIDLFSVPAMSSKPERIFSLTGQMITAQRGRLKADLIGAA
ncbi:hypothetical protein EYZ11_010945 [Aspergillus tanneri]|uniref:HAT C-terminal dimerisation domain-containing protein n=1 Tax=Aspergillus tanneri TaxID=1220188 RepID=A0A4S3J426_9EURO|nr:uncharacterized protein ATNIH1004_005363 [Aspergillus tanneri]KAA8646688.1 hypothetical protein ATNIH1004_005363 [Aspergillus tanneri]THC89613.1 hypothetical protein EYZ11_010945 [Aspergillus tanneri]